MFNIQPNHDLFHTATLISYAKGTLSNIESHTDDFFDYSNEENERALEQTITKTKRSLGTLADEHQTILEHIANLIRSDLDAKTKLYITNIEKFSEDNEAFPFQDWLEAYLNSDIPLANKRHFSDLFDSFDKITNVILKNKPPYPQAPDLFLTNLTEYQLIMSKNKKLEPSTIQKYIHIINQNISRISEGFEIYEFLNTKSIHASLTRKQKPENTDSFLVKPTHAQFLHLALKMKDNTTPIENVTNDILFKHLQKDSSNEEQSLFLHFINSMISDKDSFFSLPNSSSKNQLPFLKIIAHLESEQLVLKIEDFYQKKYKTNDISFFPIYQKNRLEKTIQGNQTVRKLIKL